MQTGISLNNYKRQILDHHIKTNLKSPHTTVFSQSKYYRHNQTKNHTKYRQMT